MAISHDTKLYAVEDCKIAAVTADPAGGTTTYGTLKDVPGIKEVGLGGDINNVKLSGDNRPLDSNSTLKGVTLSVTHAKLSLDVLAIILGGTVADAGSGSTETATYLRDAADTLGYFKLEAKTPTNGADTIGGDAHIVLYKCMLSSFPEIGFAEEDYKIVSFEAEALPLLSNSDWFSVVLNETAAAIA